MSKTALIARMRQATPGLTTAEATEAVDRVFDAVRDELAEGRDVRIPGFGTFKRKFRDTRKVRNPRTGESSILAAHHVISFKEAKPSKK